METTRLRWRSVLIGLTVVVGCKTGQPVERAASPAGAADACIAGSLATLTSELPPRPECENDDARCAAACAAGDAESCYLRGVQVENSESDGTPLYRRSCEGGLAIGCTNYAAGLWKAGNDADVRCAQRIFSKTCAVGDAWGCGMSGRLLVEGPNVSPAELQRGRQILESACERVGHFACRALAYELEQGRLGATDPATIKKLLSRACATGDEDSCGNPKTARDTFHE